jgi:ATP-dependent protease ClpP protease subunit
MSAFVRGAALAATSRWLADLAPCAPPPADKELLQRAMFYANRRTAPNETPAKRQADIELADISRTRIFEAGPAVTVIHLIGELTFGFPVASTVRAIEGATEVGLFIDCMGGDIFAALEIHAALARKKRVTATVMGSCFSAATLILCAGQERRIVSSGRVMAHAPISFCGGTPTELRAAADNLDQTRATMAAILKTCCAPALVEKWLSTGDHYMTADWSPKFATLNHSRQ